MRVSEREQLLFWMFTALLAVLMVGSAARALLDYPWARASFEHLGFPTYIIVPLEIAKLLGVAAVLSNVSPFLKNLAYAGFFYHLILALSAHVAAGDEPEIMSGAALGLVLLAGSFHFDRRRGSSVGG
ncbi:MAG: DoxX family protein [Acidobacteria bacterium]|nr:DoxX family protein [Acidobacteriota bacterium]